MRQKKTAAVALALCALLLFAGCAYSVSPRASGSPSATGEFSRVHYYSSIGELRAASALVIVGTVLDQRVASDIPEDSSATFTISSLRVITVDKSSGSIQAGDTIQVRQIGEAGTPADPTAVAPAPILDIGENYLLYLVPSGLDGDRASQFYVVGGDAGLYRAAPKDTSPEGRAAAPSHLPHTFSFVQVQADPGDTLPATISEASGTN